MRSPSALSDVSVKPSFLRTTLAKKPRTECCCQPVTFTMAAIVAPLGCVRRVRTASCLLPLRLEAEGVFPSFPRGFARPLGALRLCLVGRFAVRHFRILSVATASGAVTTEAPQWRHRQRGRIQMGPSGPYQHGDTDAPSAPEVQSFLPKDAPLTASPFWFSLDPPPRAPLPDGA